MKKSLFTLFILALFTAAGFAQMSEMEKAIIEKEKGMYEAIKAGDMNTFSSNLADDFTAVYAHGIFNRSEELQNVKSLNIDSYELSDVSVIQPAKGVAIITYKNKSSGTYMGQAFSGTYHCASAWKESNGKWLAVMHTDIEAKKMGDDEDMEEDNGY